MKSPLPLILLLSFLASCTSPEERAIEATLTFAGANRTELDRPARIDHIVYVSRNDDNYVAPGETYELFYQNGVEGWKSLGIQTATDERLVYENVPRGALLWLHNHTRGVEEQVFCYRL